MIKWYKCKTCGLIFATRQLKESCEAKGKPEPAIVEVGNRFFTSLGAIQIRTRWVDPSEDTDQHVYMYLILVIDTGELKIMEQPTLLRKLLEN